MQGMCACLVVSRSERDVCAYFLNSAPILCTHRPSQVVHARGLCQYFGHLGSRVSRKNTIHAIRPHDGAFAVDQLLVHSKRTTGVVCPDAAGLNPRKLAETTHARVVQSDADSAGKIHVLAGKQVLVHKNVHLQIRMIRLDSFEVGKLGECARTLARRGHFARTSSVQVQILWLYFLSSCYSVHLV